MCVCSIAGIRQHRRPRHVLFYGCPDLLQGKGWLRCKLDFPWNPSLSSARLVVRPRVRQIQTPGRSAGSPDWCRPTDSPPRGSSPACPPAHNIAAPRPPNAFLSLGNRCHPRSKPALALFDAWPSTHSYALQPALLHRSTARPPLRGAATDASAAHCLVPDGPPLAPRFCVLPVTAILRNTSSTALPDRRAPRLAPGLLYMPQSASPAGPARSVCPQNHFTRSCSVYNTVVLRRCLK